MQPHQHPRGAMGSWLESMIGPPPPPPKWYQLIDWQNFIERLMLALTTVTVVYLSPVNGVWLAVAVVIMFGLIKIAAILAAAYEARVEHKDPDNE